MSPKSEHVARELLAIGFRAYPRGLLNGFLFACVTVALLWEALPHGFLTVWSGVFLALIFGRLALARAFLRGTPRAEELDDWVRYAAIGFGAVGLAWGVIGAAAIHFAYENRLYTLWVIFLVGLFAVQHTQNTGAHRWVFRAFLFSAMVPIVVVSVVEPTEHYWLRLAAEAIFFTMAALAGGSGNRYVVESITMRYENIELLRDLTRQAAKLDSANAAKTRFLAAASHDLRQPMQAIALLVESLDGRVHEAATRKIIDSMRASVVAMSSLLNEILDISKLDAGTVKPQPAVFPVSRVLDRLRSSFAGRAAQKGLSLRVRASSALVETDEVLLYRILSNLTENALRYTVMGGVVVCCRPRGGAVSLEVWDSGIGIPADKLGDVFVEFHQLGNPGRDRAQGLGLGLAIVERTARLLGIPLIVRSRVGRGSVFAVEVARGDPAKMRAAEAVPVADNLDGCGVLVVENDRDIRDAMTLLLEGWNCRVAAAASGIETDEALAALGGAPDIVIADYDLGGENGIQVIDRIRRRHATVEGVLVSGDVSREAIKQADLAGYPMLHKPVRPARLRAMMASLRRDRAGAGA
jgi:signal transduction histidine kinase